MGILLRNTTIFAPNSFVGITLGNTTNIGTLFSIQKNLFERTMSHERTRGEGLAIRDKTLSQREKTQSYSDYAKRRKRLACI